MDDLTRMYDAELGRLKRLQDLRVSLDARIETSRDRLKAIEVLRNSPSGDDDFEQALASPDVGRVSLVAAPSGDEADGEGRFGTRLLEFSRHLIIERGPKTVEQLLEMAPAELLRDIEGAGKKYPPAFRAKRVFRRSSLFHVNRKDGKIAFVGDLEAGDVPIVKKLLVRNTAVESVVVDLPDGVEEVLPIERFSAEVVDGRMFGVRGPNRISAVVFTDGFYRSMHHGETNDDMRSVPREQIEKGSA